MLADDPRHDTVAGYKAGCRDQCCRDAANRYNQARKLALSRHQISSLLVPAIGTRRRLQALSALGWSMPAVQARTGLCCTYLRRLARGEITKIEPKTYTRVRDVFDDLGMQLPPTATPRQRQSVNRVQAHAKARGWLPPLAWDDIEHDEQPATTSRDTGIDQVVVERILAGDLLPTTTAERRAVTAAWPTTGRSYADLARLTGWKVERYHQSSEAA